MTSAGINVVLIPSVQARRERYVRWAEAMRRRHEELGGEAAEEHMPRRIRLADLRLHGGARALFPLFVGKSATGEPAIHGFSIPVSEEAEMPEDLLKMMRAFMRVLQRAARLGRNEQQPKALHHLIRTIRLQEGMAGRMVTVFMPSQIVEMIRPVSPPAPPPGLREAVPVWEETFGGLSTLNELARKLSRVLRLPSSAVQDSDEDEEEMASAAESKPPEPPGLPDFPEEDEGDGGEGAPGEPSADGAEEREPEDGGVEEEAADVQLDPALMAEALRVARELQEEPAVLRVPHPAVFLAHVPALLGAAFSGMWSLLYLPLALRHPWLLPLVPHGVVLRLAFPHLLGLEPAWIALIAVVFVGSWLFFVSTAYRAARYQLSLWRGAMAVLTFVASAISSMRPRPAAAGNPASGGPASGGAGEVRFSVPRASEAAQAADVLVFLAACLHHVPLASFLAPLLLSASLAVEAKGSPVWNIPAILGLILFHVAGEPAQRLAALGVAALGAPGFWLVPTSEFGAAWREVVERGRGLLSAVRGRSLKEWLALLSSGAPLAPVRRPRLIQPPSDPAARELLPVIERMEKALGLREVLARYGEVLQLALRAPQMSSGDKHRVRQELETVQALLGTPRLLLPELVHRGVYHSYLRVAAQPALLTLPVQQSSPYPVRRRWQDEDDEEGVGESLGKILADPDAVGALFRRVQEEMRRGGGDRIRAEFDADRGLIKVSHVRPVTDEWKAAISREALRDPPRHRVESSLSVFVPFGYSAIRPGEGARVEFGMVATPKASAHMVIAAPTRGGKSNMLAFWALQSMRADADPSLPFRLGVMLIDGKGETVANFAFAADRMLLPPFRHRPDAPGQTLYLYAALYTAVQRRNAFSAEIRNAASRLEAAGLPVPEPIRKAVADPNAFSAMAALFPEAALYLVVFIDEFWAIRESLGGMQSIQVKVDDQTIRMRATDLAESALNFMIIAAASAGFAVIPTTQSTRRDALNNPALRDNASVAVGSGIQPGLVHPILSENMKAAMGAITAQYHKAGSGGAGIPLYAFMALLRAAGYARWDGDRIIRGGETVGREDMQEAYAGDLFYAPYTPPEEARRLLPAFRPFRLRPESVRALEEAAQGLGQRGLLKDLPLMARVAEASVRGRTEEEIVAILREMLSWVDPSEDNDRKMEEIIRLGQEGVVRIARAAQEKLSASEARED